ncbi:hypothetical protein PLUTO_00150 [Luteibacter phage vB_LflM-Pluto]|uniref:Uncharacterized protein n=1 Tax=Luteibacter phage vB_LflM-Pluto TaxID=2948611 RepID=A0A9E7SLX8_9CAUD|nr:hypothetical protein PLUTO_00150 [Luteibacter phage vB_LflM-Pluto]
MAVVQKQQPTQQGVPTSSTVFFEKLFDIPFGWAKTNYVYNDGDNTFSEDESSSYQTTFQISALAIQNVLDTSLPTASDIVSYLRGFITSRATIREFMKVGVNMYRVSQVRNPYFEDDRHQNEAAPSFDLVLTHSRVVTTKVGAVDEVEGRVIGYP